MCFDSNLPPAGAKLVEKLALSEGIDLFAAAWKYYETMMHEVEEKGIVSDKRDVSPS